MSSDFCGAQHRPSGISKPVLVLGKQQPPVHQRHTQGREKRHPRFSKEASAELPMAAAARLLHPVQKIEIRRNHGGHYEGGCDDAARNRHGG